jgi:hypothetical protein
MLGVPPATPASRTRSSSGTDVRMLFGDARERVEDILVALPKPDRKTVAPASH